MRNNTLRFQNLHIITNLFYYFVYAFADYIGRDRDIDLPADEVIVDVITPFKDSKEPVEMTIGDGMEFTIPGT
jgi:hypothetical protein